MVLISSSPFFIHTFTNTKGLFLSQTKNALDLLQQTSMTNAKPSSTPFVCGHHLSAEGKLFSDLTLFRSLAGTLQYLTITRPIYPFLLIPFVNLCMLQPKIIFVLSSVFCLMLKTQLIMNFNFINNPLMILLSILMRTGLVVLIHFALLLIMLSFFTAI